MRCFHLALVLGVVVAFPIASHGDGRRAARRKRAREAGGSTAAPDRPPLRSAAPSRRPRRPSRPAVAEPLSLPRAEIAGAALAKLVPEGRAVTRVTVVGAHRARLELERGAPGGGDALEVDTRALNQELDQPAWLACRDALDVTASEFSAAAFDDSRFVKRSELLAIKAGECARPKVGGEAVRFGRANEPRAVAQYARETGHSVAPTGLWLDARGRWGASPDGVVVDSRDGSEGLLEVKCSFARRRKPAHPQFEHCPRRYYAQVQGQLALAGREWCDLVLWIPRNSPQKNYCVVRVARDRKFWDDELEPALARFSEDLERRRSANEARP